VPRLVAACQTPFQESASSPCGRCLFDFFCYQIAAPEKTGAEFGVAPGHRRGFAFAVQSKRIYLRAFVMMPDHWHALIGLREPWSLPRFIHAFMSHVGATTSAHLTKHHTAWQDGYYETLIKTARQFTHVVLYIEENPVKRRAV
jgi:hypothetical protein